jgi:hypothetical protein
MCLLSHLTLDDRGCEFVADRARGGGGGSVFDTDPLFLRARFVEDVYYGAPDGPAKKAVFNEFLRAMRVFLEHSPSRTTPSQVEEWFEQRKDGTRFTRLMAWDQKDDPAVRDYPVLLRGQRKTYLASKHPIRSDSHRFTRRSPRIQSTLRLTAVDLATTSRTTGTDAETWNG